MGQSISDIWTALKDPANHGALTLVVTVIIAVVGGLWAIYQKRRKKPPVETTPPVPGNNVNAQDGSVAVSGGVQNSTININNTNQCFFC